MLHKCANPQCAKPFRRLSEGRLFLLESEVSAATVGRAKGEDRGGRRIEHFWLCDECAPVLTLSFEKGRGMVAVPRVGTAPIAVRQPVASARAEGRIGPPPHLINQRLPESA